MVRRATDKMYGVEPKTLYLNEWKRSFSMNSRRKKMKNKTVDWRLWKWIKR